MLVQYSVEPSILLVVLKSLSLHILQTVLIL